MQQPSAVISHVHIAIVIVASDLRIRRFTPMAERILNLIPTDIGRPISHIKPNIDCPDLEELIGEVMDTVTPKEREVRDQQGHWMSLRIRPYKNVENRIDGAVLTLFDVAPSKRQEEALRKAHEGDPLSAFGGVFSFNRPVDEATARQLTEPNRFVVVLPSSGG